MSKRGAEPPIQCPYYRWRLYHRGGIYQADGRSNTPPLKRYSLDTADKDEARKALIELDCVMAVRNGLAKPTPAGPSDQYALTLEEGRRHYEQHLKRPAVAQGVQPSTRKRYKAVLDKFLPFAERRGIKTWAGVTENLLNLYAAWLDGDGYAYRTQYLELTTIKQIIKFLSEKGVLPATVKINMTLPKARGTTTYCYTREQVDAMLEICYADERLHWLGDVIMGLIHTGMRISELGALKWADVDLEKNVIRLTDTSRGGTRVGMAARTTKSHADRTIIILPSLAKLLRRLPQRRGGRVFHGPRGAKLSTNTVRNTLIAKVIEPLAVRFPTPEDEIGFRDGRVHSFRHYFCSSCADEGVPREMLMKMLSHKDSAMVAHYYHARENVARQVFGNLQFASVDVPETTASTQQKAS